MSIGAFWSIVAIILSYPIGISIQNAAAELQVQFLFRFGSGCGLDVCDEGEFLNPSGVAVDSSENIIVADRATDCCPGQISKFDKDGNFLFRFGGLNEPGGIAVDSSDNIIAINRAGSINPSIHIFDKDGNFLYSFDIGSVDDSAPEAVVLDSSDNIIVADSTKGKIQAFDHDGNFLFNFGSAGSGDGEFNFPAGIAVDSSDNIVVVDSGNQRVQVFDKHGNFLFNFGSAGSGDGEFNFEIDAQTFFGIAVDSSDNIIVADNGNHRIQVFDKNGHFLLAFSNFENNDGDLVDPHGVAAAKAGRIIVSDDDAKKRIQVYAMSSTDSRRENSLRAGNGVISLGGTNLLTQKLDTSASVTGKLLSLTVLEPDGDTCVANSLPETIPPSGMLTREYPTDFSLDTAGGDGACNTTQIGVYKAESEVEVDGVVSKSTAEFKTNFFVIPESPVGAAALIGSSLAALGGFMYFRRHRNTNQRLDS